MFALHQALPLARPCPARPLAARAPAPRVALPAPRFTPAAAAPQPVLASTAAAAAEPVAIARRRFARGSSFKLRRVLDTIRGRSYEEALMILEFLPYRAVEPILATLISAAANAKNNMGMSKAKLYVSECFADQAGKLKRFRPRAKGRGFAIMKPISHLTIKVKERDQAEGVVAAADRAAAEEAAKAIQAEGGEAGE